MYACAQILLMHYIARHALKLMGQQFKIDNTKDVEVKEFHLLSYWVCIEELPKCMMMAVSTSSSM